ncbi:MAG TPA: division/cell wall cluster transcriptional repressor MraZ [candidate division Zixibacteria bacterium]|nr:division/cell wall cluster transcriptional repressor MraZ [candidate division Zixibacteria bacterium]
MTAFKGSYKFTLDHKGRVNIPAKLRKATAGSSYDSFVITRGLEECLFVFALDEWEKIEEKLRSLSFTQSHHRLFIRILLSNASDANLDGQGRIAIPQNLLKLANIDKEVLILGALQRIEIWNPEIFEKYLKQADQTYEQVAEKILF